MYTVCNKFNHNLKTKAVTNYPNVFHFICIHLRCWKTFSDTKPAVAVSDLLYMDVSRS